MTIWTPRLANRRGPKYLAIVEALADDCTRGVLAAGARLPTHRELAENLHVTVGTVSRAYAEAARRGLVSGEVGRGTFVRGELPGEGEAADAIVDLGQNHPPDPPSQPQHRALLHALATLTGHGDLAPLLGYPPAGGSREDREAGASWVGRAGVAASADEVLVCTGSQHGLTVLLATLLEPGDVLLTESLTYAGIKAVAGLLRVRLRGLAIDECGVRPDALAQACRHGAAKAVYLMPTLHNPTTAVMPAKRRREIAHVARQHGLAIVEDDVHGLLAASRPQAIASLAPERTYYLTSTSKTLAPGLRIAYVKAPSATVPRLAASLRATTWAVAPLTAAIASSWIRDGSADTLLAARREEARARQALVRERLPHADLATHPEAYYFWLRLPSVWSAERFTAAARARRVIVTPAEAFAVGTQPPSNAVRVCIGAPRTRRALVRGLDVLAELSSAAGQVATPVV